MRVTKGSAFYSNVDGKGRYSGNLSLTKSEEIGEAACKRHRRNPTNDTRRVISTKQ